MEIFLNGEDWQIRLEMSNGIPKELKNYGRGIHYLQNGGKGILIQNQVNKGIILRGFEGNMDQEIKYFDFLFEGFTSDLIEENNNKKKSVKKHKKKGKKLKKNPDGTTSSGRHPGPPQDILYP